MNVLIEHAGSSYIYTLDVDTCIGIVEVANFQFFYNKIHFEAFF